MTDRPMPRTGRGGRVDVDAMRAGLGVCIMFAAPLQIGAQLVGRSSGLSLPLRIMSLVGFLLGAGVAAWVQRRDLPLVHALVTAIAAYVLVALGFIVARAIAGHDQKLGAAVANLAPVIGVGLVGGLLGQRLRSAGTLPSTQRRTGGRI